MTEQRVPVGVRFKEAGKVYYFDAGGFDLDVGSYVVVETSHGQEVGRVVISPDQVIASEIKESLKPILRIASTEDLETAQALKKKASERLVSARQEAAEEGSRLVLVGGDYSLDETQLTFYFTAEDRIDFRELAKRLSARFGMKVQLLQVGDRDRAKLVDGIGRCGERLCCSSWLTTFPTVSIRMAKEQDLPLNPSKLSGACGRLLCCLTYEFEQYREIKGTLPKVGARISTPSGEARVLKINVPKETILLLVGDPSERVEMPLDQFRLMYGTAVRPIELTQKFEKDLMATEGAPAPVPAPERPPQRAVQDLPAPAPAEGTATTPEGQDGAPRRRRRRGGKRRRRGRGSGGGTPT
ncbi:MAG: stage 0 sporulation family protein [Dehalococcoidia bacterium]